MDKNALKKELDEIEEKLNKISGVLEVAANSCSFNEDYGCEDLLREAIRQNSDLVEKIGRLEVKYGLVSL